MSAFLQPASSLLLVLVVATSLASGPGCASSEPRRQRPTGPVLVEITNHNVLDMNVYVVSGSQTIRLGTVTTNRTETFELPTSLSPARSLRLLVDPIGARSGFLTDEVVANPGDVVQLTVQPNLPTSTTSIR